MNPYLCGTPEERGKMLETLGLSSMEDLFTCIPGELKTPGFPEMPPLREYELKKEINRLASRNLCMEGAVSFMGGGSCEHFIPSVVPALAGRAEFVTAYTPYQAEASQGSLQVFFEYQSLVCRLFEMDVSNASMYDGATALAEGVIMAASQAKDRTQCLVADTLHPNWLEVLRTYTENLDIELEILPSKEGVVLPATLEGKLTDRVACVVFQNPNFLGCIEEMREISEITHKAGAFLVAAVDPLSLPLLAPPGEYKADVAVAEGQSLGLPPYFGGETLGIFTCTEQFMRKLPGRLVGMTKDTRGRRGYVLTLQTREQHIRREKATSNICTNHALNATRATIYLSSMGPEGLSEVARSCHQNAEYAKKRIREVPGFEIPFAAPTFKEFTVKMTNGDPGELAGYLSGKKCLIGPALGSFYPERKDSFLLCVTEMRTREEIDRLVDAISEIIIRKGKK